MAHLTPLQTHNLIKKAIPDAETYYEKHGNQEQLVFEWAQREAQLKKDNPEVFNALMDNIVRAQEGQEEVYDFWGD